MTNLHGMHQDSINRAVGWRASCGQGCRVMSMVEMKQTEIPQTQKRTCVRTARRNEGEREREPRWWLTKTVVSGPRGALGAASTGVRPDTDMLTGRSVQACLSRDVPSVPRGTRPKQQLQKEHETCPFLLYSRLEVAQLRREAPQRPKQNTRSTLVSTPRPSARADLSKTTTRAEAGQSNKPRGTRE